MLLELLPFVIAILSVLAILAGLRIYRMTSEVEPLRLPAYQASAAADGAAQSMRRLFQPADDYFLRSQKGFRPHLKRRLRRSRRQARALFLAQHYAEFRRLMAVAAESARGADSEFGSDLLSLSIRFHVLYLLAWLESSLLGRALPPIPHERIAAMVRGLRGDLEQQGKVVPTH